MQLLVVHYVTCSYLFLTTFTQKQKAKCVNYCKFSIKSHAVGIDTNIINKAVKIDDHNILFLFTDLENYHVNIKSIFPFS